MSIRISDFHFYVGTYTSNGGEGIYLYKLDPLSGEANHVSTLQGVVNPSFLALDPRKNFLYAVNEVESYYGKPEGSVSAFGISRDDCGLSFINQKSSLGGLPCHISVDADSRNVYVANYGAGSIAVFPIMADGSLGAASEYFQHAGSGPKQDRQSGPHAHCILPDPAGRHIVAVDLGADRIMVYRHDAQGKLVPNATPYFHARPGVGPRHLVFHPDGRHAYVINELESSATLLGFDPEAGAFTHLETVTSLPEGFAGANFPSGIQVDKAGRFLYVSNRGHDSIAWFRIDPVTRKLTWGGCIPTLGKFPRHFTLDPSGKFLLAANQRSDSIVIFAVDAESGKLTFTGKVAYVPSPSCLLFL